MHHDGIDADCEAVSDAQAEHLESLGWRRVDVAALAEEPPEQIEETFDGTTSSLGADLVIEEAPENAVPLAVVPAGTVDEVLAWVAGDDTDTDAARLVRARLALDAEHATDHPRKGITVPLTAATTED